MKIDKQEYAQRKEVINGKQKHIYMHVEIMQPPPGTKVDHKDTNGLNNQDENLRVATHSQNLQNRPKNRNNTSGYKGVHRDKRNGKYRVKIQAGYRQIYIGTFDTPEEAAQAYDQAARKYFGEFANLNFPKQ